jgi:hypothetical protein
MAVTKVGLVHYADDPEKRVIRRIYPTAHDSEITDEMCPCGGFIPFVGVKLPSCGDLHWRGHLDPSRVPVIVIVEAGSDEDVNAPTVE